MSTLTTINIEVPRLTPEQLAIKKHPARFKVLNCGRRWGKTVLGKQVALELVLAGYPVWWTAITYGNVEESWRWFVSIFRQIPSANIILGTRDIEMPNGGYIGVRSLEKFDNLRGRGLYRAFIDEAAFTRQEAYQNVIRPMLLDYGDQSGAWLMSSPNGRNWFWNMYQLGLDPATHEYQSWHYTAYDNPRIPKHELDRVKDTTPERTWRQEYMAEFVDDAGAVFRNIEACKIKGGGVPEPIEGHEYIFGVDWAQMNDYTVIVCIDANTREVVAIDRFNQIDYPLQAARLNAMYEKWKPYTVVVETNSIGLPNIQYLRRDYDMPISPFTTTAKTKHFIIDALVLAFEKALIRIPDNPVLIGELLAYSINRTPAGNVTYSAPEGQHDDIVMALAMAWSRARSYIGEDYLR